MALWPRLIDISHNEVSNTNYTGISVGFGWTTTAEGRKAVGYQDGRMTLFDTSADEGKQVLAQHDALVEWIRGNVQILPMPLGVDLPQPDLWDKIGAESSMVARVAANSKASVYADDLGFRVALGAIKVAGFSSFALVQWAHQEVVLSSDDLRLKMVGLLYLNHSFLPIDGAVLIAAIDESLRKVTSALRQVVKQLGGSHCELAGAAQVSAVVMRDLRLRELTAGEHDEVLDLLLEAMFSERESSKVHAALTQELRRACRLLPMHLESLLALIDRFLRRRAGASLIQVP